MIRHCFCSQHTSAKTSNCAKESWDQQNIWEYLNSILEWWINEKLGSQRYKVRKLLIFPLLRQAVRSPVPIIVLPFVSPFAFTGSLQTERIAIVCLASLSRWFQLIPLTRPRKVGWTTRCVSFCYQTTALIFVWWGYSSQSRQQSKFQDSMARINVLSLSLSDLATWVLSSSRWSLGIDSDSGEQVQSEV